MPLPPIQLPSGIQVLNPQPADWSYGGYATTAAAIAALPLALRYDGMTVKITGAGEYWWLAADLSDTGLIPKTGGGTNPLGIVNDVYLVNDLATQTKMGGISNNVYITFQDAYDAANTLQITLGGTNKVNIRVGVTTSAAVGNLTLTANFNQHVTISGISYIVSQVGNIIGTNASGNGFSVGSNLLSNFIRVSNVDIGNITTNATGTTGNSGLVVFASDNARIGNVDTSITNVANTTGNGGNVGNVNAFNKNIIIFGSITTSAKGTSALAGNVGINEAYGFVGTITTCQNNLGGFIALTNVQAIGIAYNNSGITSNANITLTNVTVAGTVSINQSPGTINVTFKKGCIFSAITVTNNGTGTTVINVSQNCVFGGVFTSNNNSILKATKATFNRIVSLGANSYLGNCMIDTDGAAVTSVNGIGTGCILSNTTIHTNVGSLSIDNGTPVSVTTIATQSVIENAVGANVTLI